MIEHRNLFPSHTDLMRSSRLTVFLVKSYSFSSLKNRCLELALEVSQARIFQILRVGDPLGHFNHQHTWTGFPGDGNELGLLLKGMGGLISSPPDMGAPCLWSDLVGWTYVVLCFVF